MSVTLVNARIRTSDPAQPTADALVIDGDRIAWVGESRSRPPGGGGTVLDLGGRTVLPGLVDAHAHPAALTRSAWHVRLPWTEDVEEILAFVRRYAEEHPREEAPYLYFEYYPSTTFTHQQPTRELLDSAVSDRPVLCQDFSDHQHWVNSRMLELMGVTKDTPDPVPGLQVFVRDQDGEPTGLIREAAHHAFLDTMYDSLGWRPPEQITPERLAATFAFLTRNGVTSVFEALLEDDEVLAATAELERRGELPLYYEAAVFIKDPHDVGAAIDRLRSYQEQYASDRIGIRTLKLMLDGTNESGNSAVLEPLLKASHGHELGESSMTLEELTTTLQTCNREGVDLHIHLVGDRAFRVACDAVAAAQRSTAQGARAWRIQVTLAHCELVDPADMHLPAELGIFVNWTPHWSGGYFGEEAREHLGPERFDRMYDFSRMIESGAVLTFGSDTVTHYEMQRGAPLFGMQVAATRVDPQYPLSAERYPGSVRPPRGARIPVEVLLRGHTADAARQLRLHDRLGALVPGHLANLVVLGADPHEVDPGQLATTPVEAVLFEGRLVHGCLPEPVSDAAPHSPSAAPTTRVSA